MQFCWTTIAVSNMDRSLSFYQEIIGLKLNRRIKPNNEMELSFLGEGETQIELIYNKKSTDITFGKDISLGFVVESTSQFTDYLNSKNIKIHSGPFQPNPLIKFIYVQDPDGLKIQFVENISQ